ncbi:MAG: hypothetical protein WD875_06040 [Pirellulales bacterium]
MRTTCYALLGCLGLLLTVGGCRSATDDDASDGKKDAEKEVIKIAPLAGKLGAFDDGRIEVPLPKGWHESKNEENSKNDLDQNLARMSSGETQRYPGIDIKVREYGDFKTLGESELRKFVRNRSTEVQKEHNPKGDAKVKFDVKPLSLRSFHGVEYAYRVKISGQSLERLTLETVVDSRMYTLELTTVIGLREQARPALYAVATGMKFPKMVNKPSAGRRGRDADDEQDSKPADDKEKAADNKKDEAKDAKEKETKTDDAKSEGGE